MKFYGVDLHSDNVTVAVIGERTADIKTARYNLHSPELQKFFDSLTKEDYVMVEASTNTFWFYDQVAERVNTCFVIDPYKFTPILKENFKTDKRDAATIAASLKYSVIFGAKLPTVYIPKPETRILRQLLTTYDLINKQIVMVKNRIHSLLKQNGFIASKKSLEQYKIREKIMELDLDDSTILQIKVLFQQLDDLWNEKQEIQNEALRKGHVFKQEIKLLVGIKGISIFEAIVMMAEIGDVHRFSNAKSFCSYLRTAPTVDSSNKRTHIGKINKHSRKRVLTLFLQSFVHIIGTRKMSDFYQRVKQGLCPLITVIPRN